MELAKDQMPFKVSSHGEDITIFQGKTEIYLCPRSAELLIEVLQGIVQRKGLSLEDFNLPTESQVRQQASYLFGQNRDALSDKEEDLFKK